jgi:hypothetical protein
VRVQDVDFLRRELHVRQQLVCPSSGAPELAKVKEKTSIRTIGLSSVVLDALSAHLAELAQALRTWCSTSTGGLCPGPPAPRRSHEQVGLSDCRRSPGTTFGTVTPRCFCPRASTLRTWQSDLAIRWRRCCVCTHTVSPGMMIVLGN